MSEPSPQRLAEAAALAADQDAKREALAGRGVPPAHRPTGSNGAVGFTPAGGIRSGRGRPPKKLSP